MELILASSSTYRAQVLRDAGYVVETYAPVVDERALDHWLATHGPEALALELARRKLDSVLARLTTDRPVVAADQVGVLDGSSGPVLLTKAADARAAVDQLRRLSGTTHRLVNGLVVWRGGRIATGVDVQEVTFRSIADHEVRAYVEEFVPFDTAGSYRLEDDGRAGRAPFVVDVVGEDPSGVLGLPLPLLARLLQQVDGATSPVD